MRKERVKGRQGEKEKVNAGSRLGKVARYALRSVDARHECKRSHYVRVREVKRFTTPVACGLGQARVRERKKRRRRESWDTREVV